MVLFIGFVSSWTNRYPINGVWCIQYFVTSTAAAATTRAPALATEPPSPADTRVTAAEATLEVAVPGITTGAARDQEQVEVSHPLNSALTHGGPQSRINFNQILLCMTNYDNCPHFRALIPDN